MLPWRIVAGIFGLVASFFAVTFARLAIGYFELSALNRQIVGREIPEDGSFTHAVGYLVASQVMAALAGALICFAVVARSKTTDPKPESPG